jgi:hypothetical protein
LFNTVCIGHEFYTEFMYHYNGKCMLWNKVKKLHFCVFLYFTVNCCTCPVLILEEQYCCFSFILSSFPAVAIFFSPCNSYQFDPLVLIPQGVFVFDPLLLNAFLGLPFP